MKTKIGKDTVIFEYLRRGAGEPDDFVDENGISYSRVRFATELDSTGKIVLKYDADGKPLTVRNRGKKVGVILALKDGRIGWSHLDDEDYFMTYPFGLMFNKTFAIALAYKNAFLSEEEKKASPIPTKFRYDYKCMLDRSFRYFGKNEDNEDGVYQEVISGVIYNEPQTKA